MTPKPAIAAYANCDDTYVVWRYPAPIPECRGFALIRKAEDGSEEPVNTFVSFAGESHTSGQHQPSTVWPIQRFGWTDTFAKPGKKLRYRIIPMVGKAGALSEAKDHASEWTDEVEVTAAASKELSAYFNRGVLATQAVARRMKHEEPWTKELGKIIATPGNPTRDYLSGELRPALLQVLKEAVDTDDAEVYAALFELNDPELISELLALKGRAHVILANGTEADGDENAAARKELKDGGVDVRKRMTGDRLAHNKFLVACDGAGKPQTVWTGSTNWTMTALCTQVNNGLLIKSPGVAEYFKKQWEALAAAGNDFPKVLVDGNSVVRSAPLKEGGIRTWFVPVHKEVDLEEARGLIAEAEHGILFLFFFPGRKGTLFNAIWDRADPTSPNYDKDLYVHGVANQDPEAGSKDISMVNLIHRGQLDEADPDVVLPSKIDKRFASWDEEIGAKYKLVAIHSKVVVLDPFGSKPIVMTGSHNLGPAASKDNDDNLNLIAGVPKLAQAYATHIIAVYNDYRWRYVRSQKAKAKGEEWQGPEDGKAWQDAYYSGKDAEAKQHELAFWLGS